MSPLQRHNWNENSNNLPLTREVFLPSPGGRVDFCEAKRRVRNGEMSGAEKA